MIDKYLVQGAEVTNDTLIECMDITASGLQTSTSAKGLSDSLLKVEIDEYLKESFEYFMADNSGKMSFGNESASNTVKNGATRVAQYSSEWGDASLQEAIDKFAPNIEPVVTLKGKIIYNNQETGN